MSKVSAVRIVPPLEYARPHTLLQGWVSTLQGFAWCRTTRGEWCRNTRGYPGLRGATRGYAGLRGARLSLFGLMFDGCGLRVAGCGLRVDV